MSEGESCERANPPTPALLLTPPSALPSLSPSFRSPSILHLLNTQRRARDAERQWMRGWMPSALPHLYLRLLLSLIQAASVHLFLSKCDGKTRMFSPSFLHHNLCHLFGRCIFFLCAHWGCSFCFAYEDLSSFGFLGKMIFSPKFSLSNIHVRLTAKGLLRNLQLLSGCKSTVVFRAGLFLRKRCCCGFSFILHRSFRVFLYSSQGAVFTHVVLILSLDSVFLSLPKSIWYLYLASRHLASRK